MDMRLSAGRSLMWPGSPGNAQWAELDLVGGCQRGAGVGDTGRVGPRTPGEVEAGSVAEAPVVHHDHRPQPEGNEGPDRRSIGQGAADPGPPAPLAGEGTEHGGEQRLVQAPALVG